MSGGAPPRRRPDWGLRAAFIVNILAMGFIAYCAFVIIAILYCGLFGDRCDPWTSHLPVAFGLLAGLVLALIGAARGIRLARRGARKQAIRALLGWSALALGACFLFMFVVSMMQASAQ